MINNSKIENSKISKWFWLFCSLHLLVWTLLPSIIRHNVPFDTIEGIAWGNQWQLGYDKHPPLAAWISAAATYLGGSVGWPIYLAAQIAVVITFYAVWQLAKKILPPPQALFSVLILETLLYHGSALTIKFNPSTAMAPFWALAILNYYNAITSPKNNKYWLATGLFVGLALLAKYASAILIFAMFALLLFTTEGRRCFKSLGLYLAICIGLLVFLPNIIWLIQNNFSEIYHAVISLEKHRINSIILSHFYFATKFAIAQIMVFIPFVLIAIPLFIANKNPHIKHSTFNTRFLLIFGLGPFLITVLLSIITGSFLAGTWAAAFFTTTGVLFIYLLRPVITAKIFKVFISLIMLTIALQAGARYLWLTIRPNFSTTKHISDAYFPGKEIATDLTNKWYAKYQSKLPYVAGDHYLVANIAVYSKDKPIPYLQWSKAESPWVNEQKLREKGAIFAWYDTKKQGMPIKIQTRFPGARYLGTKIFPRSHPNLRKVTIGIAVLPPKNPKLQ